MSLKSVRPLFDRSICEAHRKTRNRNIGANASGGNSVTQTIVREQKKIGRNERVKIINTQTGELKELKYKQAEPLISTGKWIINDN